MRHVWIDVYAQQQETRLWEAQDGASWTASEREKVISDACAVIKQACQDIRVALENEEAAYVLDIHVVEVMK